MGHFGTKFTVALLCFFVSTAAQTACSEVIARPGVTRAQAARHPLDPLTSQEIVAAAAILRKSGRMRADSKFSQLSLQEPAKEKVWSFGRGIVVPREASATIFDRRSNKTFEAVVDLDRQTVRSCNEIANVQPGLMAADLEILERVVRSDSRWQEALRKRGISDLAAVHVDAWPAGSFGFQDEEGIRVVRAISLNRGKSANAYSRPIEGVVAYVDLTHGKVIKLMDTGARPVSENPFDLDAKSIGNTRPAPRPMIISQPEGQSFSRRGHEVTWQKWRFRFALHPRQGLVLYTISYFDQGRCRPVIYRASLSEMVVPYGDPSEGWFIRNAFDMGEFTMGACTDSLERLTDAPSNSTFIDAVLADEDGRPIRMSRAIALYERDGGLLWKHADDPRGSSQSRRSRELVLSTVVTLDNYDYGFNWVFRQDGTLELEALLTGIMSVKGVDQVKHQADSHGAYPYGHLIAPNLVAVHHQHFLNFRLDLDVDGSNRNSVVEHNAEALPPGPENPHNNAFRMSEQLLPTEQAAKRDMNLAANRKWKVINTVRTNLLGQATGYMLVPGENSVPYAGSDSWVRKRAGFVEHHVWVTPYRPDEVYAAGTYPYQSCGGDGLPRWTAADRSVADTDVVLWYTMGVTHIPRVEEWPVMPVHKAGFKLIPYCFFSRNPALDVPKPGP